MISKEEVEGLAALSRLTLKSGEAEILQKDISSILDYVGQVSQVPLSDADKNPPLRNVMREDTPYTEGAMLLGKREALLKAFPEREGDYLKVRTIIQKDE